MLRALQKSLQDVTTNRRNVSSDHEAKEAVAEQRGQDASMEEILASIRRIVSDEQVLPLLRSLSAQGHPLTAERIQDAAAYQRHDEAYELQRAPHNEPQSPLLDHLRRDPRQYAHQRHANAIPRPDIEPLQRAEPELAMRRPEPRGALVEEAEQLGGHLRSSGAEASVSSSFNALANAVRLQNECMVEDSVREDVRPMVKAWLDDHLPEIVERLVRQEIDRIARVRR